MAEEPTIEFQGYFAPFVVEHDCVWAVVRLPDHYLSVQLWTSSWRTWGQEARSDRAMLIYCHD